MSSPNTSFGSIETPLSPGEALARFSPLNSCRPSQLCLPKRTTSSRWCHDDANCWVEDGKATIVTRSASASAVPISAMPRVQSEHFARDRVTGWRPTSRQQRSNRYPEYPMYTEEQIKGFQLYEMKSQRLSITEYGNHMQQRNSTSGIEQHYTRMISPPTKIVELEADTPPISPPMHSSTGFECQSPILLRPINQSPIQFLSKPLSIKIARKPVGSSSSKPLPKNVRSKSDPVLIWPLEKSISPARGSRSKSPRRQKHEYDGLPSAEPNQIYSPWDTHDPPSSPSIRPRGLRVKPTMKKPPLSARFQSDAIPKQVHSHEHNAYKSPRKW
jgi:hypothetical protein